MKYIVWLLALIIGYLSPLPSIDVDQAMSDAAGAIAYAALAKSSPLPAPVPGPKPDPKPVRSEAPPESPTEKPAEPPPAPKPTAKPKTVQPQPTYGGRLRFRH